MRRSCSIFVICIILAACVLDHPYLIVKAEAKTGNIMIDNVSINYSIPSGDSALYVAADVILGITDNPEEIKRLFYKNISNDILYLS